MKPKPKAVFDDLVSKIYKGRITVPSEIRKAYGITDLNEGEYIVHWKLNGDKLVLEVEKRD